MDRSYYLFIIILSSSIIGCSGNKKASNSPADSGNIYKVWKFDTLRSAHKNIGSAWIGRNLLDLRNHDTLRFSYKSNKAMPTAYPYKITNDTIFVNKNPAYKILKLTGSELELYAIFNSSASSKTDSIIMTYKAK